VTYVTPKNNSFTHKLRSLKRLISLNPSRASLLEAFGNLSFYLSENQRFSDPSRALLLEVIDI